jgi:hypothetical protein
MVSIGYEHQCKLEKAVPPKRMRTGIKPRVLNVVSARPDIDGTLFQVLGMSVPAVIAIEGHSDSESKISRELTVRCLRNAPIETPAGLVRLLYEYLGKGDVQKGAHSLVSSFP